MKTNLFFAIFPILVFFGALNSIDGTKKKTIENTKPACFPAPIWLYSEEKNGYYRQDWCKTGKKPVYFDSIPILKETEKFSKAS